MAKKAEGTFKIEFDSDEDLESGLHEIFTNNYPFEMTPYGIFELPKEVLDKLKEKGITFHEVKTVSTLNLSTSEIKKLKKENQYIIFTK